MKRLFFASHPWLATGYGKVASFLSNYLASIDGIELVYFAFQRPERNVSGRAIHPEIRMIGNKEFGYDVWASAILEEKPDVVFLYNDAKVASHFLDTLLCVPKTFKIIVYFDLVYEYENNTYIDRIERYADHIIVFSECWMKNLVRMNVSKAKIFVLPHPIDKNRITSIDSKSAKNTIGFEENDFVILILNRNSYRKCWDITLRAFLMFLGKMNMEYSIKLFIGCLQKTSTGYDLFGLLRNLCYELYLDYDRVVDAHILTTADPRRMTDEKVNTLYNACDIGINTCCGEGFGLCNMEHAAVGRPQIITNYGGLGDIFEEEYAILINPKIKIFTSELHNAHSGQMAFCDAEDFSHGMDILYKDRIMLEAYGKKGATKTKEKYNVDVVVQRFNSIQF